MRFFRALLSAITLFGGHFLNRRLDRVILFFALLAFLGLFSYLLLPSLLFRRFDPSADLAFCYCEYPHC